MNCSQPRDDFSAQKWIIIGILLVSLVLRGMLILRGGQYYISDETRYETSRNAALLLAHGQLTEALTQFTISPEHVGFKVIGIVPALLEHLIGTSLVLPAAFFSLFSVSNLYLIFLLSRHGSRTPTEPLYVLFFAACSHSLFYYSRHLFPYDASLTFGLWALYTTMTGNQHARTSLICGLLSFLCFITYNGYWPFSAFVILANIFFNSETTSKVLQKAAFTALGFFIPLALLILGMLAAEMNMIAAYRQFARSITQGSLEEGWSLPFEYAWHAEHLLALILTALSLISISNAIKNRDPVRRLWAAGILFIYTCLFVPSVVLHDFVVYGRLARQMLPFLILLAASGLASVEKSRLAQSRVPALILAVVLIQAAWNLASSFRLSYPRQVTEDLQADFPAFAFSTKRLAFGAPTLCQNGGYAIENAKYFLQAPETTEPIVGEILWEAPHPVNFLPYQYEGYTPEQRQGFRRQPIWMRFYKVDEQFMSETNPQWLAIKNCRVDEE